MKDAVKWAADAIHHWPSDVLSMAEPKYFLGDPNRRRVDFREDHIWIQPSNEVVSYDEWKAARYKLQWRGPEDGLPPVGSKAVCKYRPDEEHIIVAHDLVSSPQMAIVCDDSGYWGADVHHWEPLRTEEDKAVEEMLALDCDPHEGMLSREDFCRALYRANFRKQESD